MGIRGKNISLIVLLLIALMGPAAFAGSASDTAQVKALENPRGEAFVTYRKKLLGNEINEDPPPPGWTAYLGKIRWGATKQEIYQDGAWLVQLEGRLISIKPGFLRGSSLGDDHSVEPVALVSDITDIDSGNILDLGYEFVGYEGCYSTSTATFYFAFTADTLTVSKCSDDKPDASFTKTIPYGKWIGKWARNASRYCGKSVKDYCFIPQETVKKEYLGASGMPDWTRRFGFVAAKKVPLSGKDGLPADFIEIGKLESEGEHSACMVNSPALKLLFQCTRFFGQGWQIYR